MFPMIAYTKNIGKKYLVNQLLLMHINSKETGKPFKTLSYKTNSILLKTKRIIF